MRNLTRSALALSVLLAMSAAGQELEPRRYVNAPVGVNFLAVAYGFSSGNVLLDPTLPIEGLDARLHVVALRYVRSVGVFGKNGRVLAVLPATSGDWQGTLEGEFRTRQIDGFGDLRVGFDVNFLGAPALKASEFGSYEARTVAGASLLVKVPTGQYDRDRLLNLGSNRWTFIPQIGVSHVLGRFTVEAAARLLLFTANTDFFGGNRFEQRPLAVIQAHGVYTFRPGLWVAIGVGLANGGRTILNDEPRDTLQQNARVGAVFAYPLSPRQGLRLSFGASMTTTNGSDFRTFGFAYQHAWGGQD